MSSQVTAEANARFAGLSSSIVDPLILGAEWVHATVWFPLGKVTSSPVVHSDYFAAIGSA